MIKDYDLGINYHLGKANVVEDAMSRKSYCTNLMVRQPCIFEELMDEDLEIILEGYINDLKLKPLLSDRIKEGKKVDVQVRQIMKKMKRNKALGFRESCGTRTT